MLKAGKTKPTIGTKIAGKKADAINLKIFFECYVFVNF